MAGPAQPINAPAGGSPAAITDVPEIGGLLTTAASVTGNTALSTVPGQVAGFASAKLTHQLLIAGASTVSLQVTAATTTDATLFVALHDESGDGRDDLPASLVAPLRLTGLTPGNAADGDGQVAGDRPRIPGRHRVVLTVATTDLAYSLPADARTYAISLAGETAAITVPTVDGRVIRPGSRPAG